jgi:hypothetical protein
MKKFITVKKMQALETSIGFLSNMNTSVNKEDQAIVTETDINDEIPKMTALLQELALLNERRRDIILTMMAYPNTK